MSKAISFDTDVELDFSYPVFMATYKHENKMLYGVFYPEISINGNAMKITPHYLVNLLHPFLGNVALRLKMDENARWTLARLIEINNTLIPSPHIEDEYIAWCDMQIHNHNM